jgi:acetylornithine deacetylase/succinyl-diaminopimelate desuccinylase-like protein
MPAESAVSRAVEISRTHRGRAASHILREFVKLLAIPNVAAKRADLQANAELLAATFARRRVRTDLLSLRTGPPFVYGELRSPEPRRTIGIYAHYDGQPVNPGRWTFGPWEPTLCTGPLEAGGRPIPLPKRGAAIDPEWRVYARSAADDKAPFPALAAAIDALQAAGQPITSNLKLLFDGEEESSSLNLPRILELYGDSYQDVDLWLLLDGPVHPSRRPQLLFGVRGVTGFELTVYGPARSLHSGHYGNWVPEPGVALARLLASLFDEAGRVSVEGFYQACVPATAAEREALARLPECDDELREELGLSRAGFDGLSRSECNMLPSVTIRGLRSAQVGERARNVIPATAEASISLRLGRGCDPDAMLDLVERHIARQGFHIVRVPPDHDTRMRHPWVARVIRHRGYRAGTTSMEHPTVAGVVEAVTTAAGEPPLMVPMSGASMPLYLFTESLGKPAVVVPIANHDNNQHAADENLRVANLWYGVDLYAALLAV